MDLEEFLIALGVVAAAGATAVVVLKRRKANQTGPSPGDLVALASLVIDVQQRAIDSFILAQLRGAQLRNGMFGQATRISYALKRQPNGVEHQLAISFEGRPPPVAGDPKDEAELAELARLAVFVTMLAKLQPVDPLDVEAQKRQLGVTRTLTELETRELKRPPHVPPEGELTALYEQASTQAKSIWRGSRAA